MTREVCLPITVSLGLFLCPSCLLDFLCLSFRDYLCLWACLSSLSLFPSLPKETWLLSLLPSLPPSLSLSLKALLGEGHGLSSWEKIFGFRKAFPVEMWAA